MRRPPRTVCQKLLTRRNVPRRDEQLTKETRASKKDVSREIVKFDFYFKREHNLQSLRAIEVPLGCVDIRIDKHRAG